jgi:hypothetical protein
MTFGWSGLIRGMSFGGSGVIRGMAFGGSGLIRGRFTSKRGHPSYKTTPTKDFRFTGIVKYY